MKAAVCLSMLTSFLVASPAVATTPLPSISGLQGTVVIRAPNGYIAFGPSRDARESVLLRTSPLDLPLVTEPLKLVDSKSAADLVRVDSKTLVLDDAATIVGEIDDQAISSALREARVDNTDGSYDDWRLVRLEHMLATLRYRKVSRWMRRSCELELTRWGFQSGSIAQIGKSQVLRYGALKYHNGGHDCQPMGMAQLGGVFAIGLPQQSVALIKILPHGKPMMAKHDGVPWGRLSLTATRDSDLSDVILNCYDGSKTRAYRVYHDVGKLSIEARAGHRATERMWSDQHAVLRESSATWTEPGGHFVLHGIAGYTKDAWEVKGRVNWMRPFRWPNTYPGVVMLTEQNELAYLFDLAGVTHVRDSVDLPKQFPSLYEDSSVTGGDPSTNEG